MDIPTRGMRAGAAQQGGESVIEFDGVFKSYRVIQGNYGFVSTIKNLFAPTYTIIRAIQDLSFRISEGELVGLIGKNGAGKSTLVKLATGILRSDGGRVLFDGIEVGKNRARCARHYGVAFGQRRALWWQLTAREGMEALGRIYRVDRSRIRGRIDQLVDIFELNEFVDRPVRQLSLGQRVRSEVASCFIHAPKIVFLDEPTIGMDAIAKVKMREYIKRINREQKVAVLLTSHDLFDVERVCERVMILDEGRLILEGTLDSIRKEFCSERIIELTLSSPIDAVQVGGIPGVEILPAADRHKLKLKFDPRSTSVFDIMDTAGRLVDIIDFTVQDIPIDEFVARIYRGE